MEFNLKEVFSYLVEIAQQAGERIVTETLDGHNYTINDLKRIDAPLARPLEVNTLDSIARFCTADRDKIGGKDLIVSVGGPGLVNVFGVLNTSRKREHFLQGNLATQGDWQRIIGHFVKQDDFVLFMQTHFQPDDERERLLALVGNLTQEAIRTDEDDGFSQTATVQTGVRNREVQDVKNQISLVPMRSFPEIELAPVPYIVRLKQADGEIPKVCLQECDGGAWKLDAIQKIGEHLSGQLPDGVALLY